MKVSKYQSTSKEEESIKCVTLKGKEGKIVKVDGKEAARRIFLLPRKMFLEP